MFHSILVGIPSSLMILSINKGKGWGWGLRGGGHKRTKSAKAAIN